MAGTEADFRAFLVEKARAEWDGSRRPYHLARVSPDLKGSDIDYREIIQPFTLKQFASSLDDVTLVQNPAARADVGIIPKGEHYEFAELPPVSKGHETTRRSDRAPLKSRDPRHVVANFLELLAGLSDEELRSVSIPVGVLARLVSRNED